MRIKKKRHDLAKYRPFEKTALDEETALSLIVGNINIMTKLVLFFFFLQILTP